MKITRAMMPEQASGETRAIIDPASASPIVFKMQVVRRSSLDRRVWKSVGLGWITYDERITTELVDRMIFTHLEGPVQQVGRDNNDRFYNSRLRYTTQKSIPIMRSSSRRPRPS